MISESTTSINLELVTTMIKQRTLTWDKILDIYKDWNSTRKIDDYEFKVRLQFLFDPFPVKKRILRQRFNTRKPTRRAKDPNLR